MLSWFRKKSPTSTPLTPAPPTSTSVSTDSGRAIELIRRWDAQRAEVRVRVEAMLAEAAAASEPLIAEVRADLTRLAQAWTAISARIHDAREEISEAWNQISDEMSECDGFTHEMMFAEGNKRDLANLELELAHERIYGGVMARAAEHMRRHALTGDAASHSCNHCGAPLDRVTPVSQSLNVECGYCASINTVHPGDALRMFAASGAMHLAAEAARHAGEAMRRLEQQIKQYREAQEVPLALLIELESTSRIYWTTRLGEQARYTPEEAKYVASKLDSAMRDTLKTLRQYWQWRDYETR